MAPHSNGAAYANFLTDDDDDGAGDRVRATYGAEKYERLVALKRKYDPENVFRFNQNIRPSRAVTSRSFVQGSRVNTTCVAAGDAALSLTR